MKYHMTISPANATQYKNRFGCKQQCRQCERIFDMGEKIFASRNTGHNTRTKHYCLKCAKKVHLI